MPVETRTQTTTKTTYDAPAVETRRTTHIVNEPVDDRSLGEKAMDALSSAAQTVKDAFTPEVKDSDIAQAAREHQELRQKEEMDRRRAEGASAQQSQLEAEAQRLQDKQFAHQREELKHAQKADEQAQKVAKLQQKQAEQQAKKCNHAVRCQGACPVTGEVSTACPVTGAHPMNGEVKITRTTEIH